MESKIKIMQSLALLIVVKSIRSLRSNGHVRAVAVDCWNIVRLFPLSSIPLLGLHGCIGWLLFAGYRSSFQHPLPLTSIRRNRNYFAISVQRIEQKPTNHHQQLTTIQAQPKCEKLAYTARAITPLSVANVPEFRIRMYANSL